MVDNTQPEGSRFAEVTIVYIVFIRHVLGKYGDGRGIL